MTSDEGRPVLRVIRGDATPEEIAALLAVVTARARAVAEPPRAAGAGGVVGPRADDAGPGRAGPGSLAGLGLAALTPQPGSAASHRGTPRRLSGSVTATASIQATPPS